MPGRAFPTSRIRPLTAGGVLLLRVWRPIDEARRPSSVMRDEPTRFVTLRNACVPRSAPASIMPRSMRQSALRVSGRGSWPWSALTMSLVFFRDDPVSSPAWRLDAFVPTSSRVRAVEDSLPPVWPWRDRWRSPAWSSVRRAFPRERARFLRARIRRPVSMGLVPRVWPGELVSMWSCLA